MHSVHDFELAVDWQSTADSTGFTNCLGPVDWQSTGPNLELSHSVRSTGSRPGLNRQFISPVDRQSTGGRPPGQILGQNSDFFPLNSELTLVYLYACFSLVYTVYLYYMTGYLIYLVYSCFMICWYIISIHDLLLYICIS